jgi:glycyl-tRNA synthetase beta chain
MSASHLSAAAVAPLLIELFTEELPPKALQKLSDSFSASIVSGLSKKHLLAIPSFESFATPRRLAVLLNSVTSQAEDQNIKVKGPSTKVGEDAQGQPTQALVKWAEKQGVPVSALTRENDGKQDCFFAQTTVKGAQLTLVLQGVLEEALAALPIPKLMQYQLADGITNVSFVRPAHRLICLHGSTVIPATILGLQSANLTEGHRFHSEGIKVVSAPEQYANVLKQAHVMASYTERRATIEAQLLAQAVSLGARLSDQASRTDQAALAAELAPYLDEVTSLVEWPKVYVGQFESAFLAVPQECLILTMRTNQKYFPLFDAKGQLLNQFLIVSNMEVADPINIVDGNQRVVRPRLSDAQFFFEQDKKSSLASRVESLGAVVYHAKLGSQAQRMARVQQMSSTLAAALSVDSSNAVRAAQLAKCDLITGMVGEFPELQGIMGRYYANHDGEPSEVAQAIAEQYMPKFAGDNLPSTQAGLIVAMADKLETLCGIWGIGQHPTGDRDPFALRRHALGLLRMLIEKQLPLQLNQVMSIGFSAFSSVANFTADAQGLSGFIVDRLRGYLKERGFDAAVIEAVLAGDSNATHSLIARLEAVTAFAALPEAQNLAAANKRIGNILRKSAEGQSVADHIDAALLKEPAEQQLASALQVVQAKAQMHFNQGEFKNGLQAMAALREPVDNFFDNVMVMAEDPAVRANRLAILAKLHQLMNQGADLARLAV